MTEVIHMPMKSIIKSALGDDGNSFSDSPTTTPGVVGIQSPRAPLASPDDEELAKIVEQLKVGIKIVGCGGGGTNTINRCMEEGVFGAEMVAANTDAKHLLTVKAHRKVLLGKRITRGLGAGALPQVGEEAAREAEEDILNALGRVDIAFITAGMGGGTGTGSAPIVADIAKRQKALVISVVTLPFTSEGRVRMENALFGLEKQRRNSDTTIVIPNDKLLQLVPRLPLDQAFKVADGILMEALKGLTEIITKPGLVNLDYADIKTIMAGGGVAMIGIGESEGTGQNKIEQAVQEAISSPLIEADISEAKGALIRVVGDDQMSVAEAEGAVRLVQQKVSPNARIIWGASIDPTLKGAIRVLVVLTGVKSPYMLGTKGEMSAIAKAAGAKGLDWNVDSV
ncbi:MAG: cell division protein FtsZ [Thermoplasmatales archaeon]|nr:cell division protein FtsZ [Thermoplasmatales archaeon]